MAWISPKLTFAKGRILRSSPIFESVENRVRQVGDLLRERRRLALAFKRTGDEAYLSELIEKDIALAAHRIDIPAIAKQRAVRKT
jgi:hypothetical protein